MLWLITALIVEFAACSCTDLSDYVSFPSIFSFPLHNFSTQLSASIEGAIQYTHIRYIQAVHTCTYSIPGIVDSVLRTYK